MHMSTTELIACVDADPAGKAHCDDAQGEPIAPTEIRAALAQLLRSPQFAKASRMCRLLSFLIEKRLTGGLRDTAEYAVGIDVFDRQPASYDTTTDPIVRVQAGRLRQRLQSYYEADGAGSALIIAIPPGGYMPLIRRRQALRAAVGPVPSLCIAGLTYLGPAGAGAGFAQGLDEALRYQMFQQMGKGINLRRFPASCQVPPAALADINFLLEGSVQLENGLVRTSARLTDMSAGRVTWYRRFDCYAQPAMQLQDELAGTIAAALAEFLQTGRSIAAALLR